MQIKVVAWIANSAYFWIVYRVNSCVLP